MIFLAAVDASFTPMFAGRGIFVGRLWFIVAGLAILLALNSRTWARHAGGKPNELAVFAFGALGVREFLAWGLRNLHAT